MSAARIAFSAFRVAVLALCILTLQGCKKPRTQTEVIDGYKGPALRNPFLAAERFLGDMGCVVEKKNLFRDVSNTYATLITSSQSFINFGDSDTALRWAERGGHLVIFLSGSQQWINDWPKGSLDSFIELFKPEQKGDEEERLFTALGLESVDKRQPALTQIKYGRRTYEADLAGTIKFKQEPRRVDIKGGDSFISFRRGTGRVTLLANAYTFRNRYLPAKDHAALLYTLATIDDRTVVYFLNGIRVSFWSMLWERAWMALIAAALLLAVWLWRNLPRFGPLLAAEDRSARDFTEHLTISGNFLWRQNAIRALLEPLQRTLLGTLGRKGMRAEEPAVQHEIATRTGLTEDRVRLACFLIEPESRQVFLRTVQDIQTIQSKL